MTKHRVICSGEKLCGCVHDVKRKQNGVIMIVGEPVVNPLMKQCSIGIQGFSADKYCCLVRETVHIIK